MNSPRRRPAAAAAQVARAAAPAGPLSSAACRSRRGASPVRRDRRRKTRSAAKHGAGPRAIGATREASYRRRAAAGRFVGRGRRRSIWGRGPRRGTGDLSAPGHQPLADRWRWTKTPPGAGQRSGPPAEERRTISGGDACV